MRTLNKWRDDRAAARSARHEFSRLLVYLALAEEAPGHPSIAETILLQNMEHWRRVANGDEALLQRLDRVSQLHEQRATRKVAEAHAAAFERLRDQQQRIETTTLDELIVKLQFRRLLIDLCLEGDLDLLSLATDLDYDYTAAGLDIERLARAQYERLLAAARRGPVDENDFRDLHAMIWPAGDYVGLESCMFELEAPADWNRLVMLQLPLPEVADFTAPLWEPAPEGTGHYRLLAAEAVATGDAVLAARIMAHCNAEEFEGEATYEIGSAGLWALQVLVATARDEFRRTAAQEPADEPAVAH